MKMRVVHCSILLAVMLLCNLSAHGATPPAFLAKLPFTIDHWNVMPPIPTVYYDDRGNHFPYQMSYLELSPSGKYLLTIRIGLNLWDRIIGINQVADGSVVRSQFIEENQRQLMAVVWDPADEQFLYANYEKPGDNPIPQLIITRQRWDGSAQQRVSQETESARLVSVSNDGKWVFAYVTPFPTTTIDLGTSGKYVMISTENPRKRTDADWVKYFNQLSPNMQFAVGNNGQVLSLINRDTSRQIQPFSVDQTLLLNPEKRDAIYSSIQGGAWWLPDSSGVLINISTLQQGRTELQALWHVKTNGEVRYLTTNVSVLAQSNNGRHWLLVSDGTWYVVTVKTPAKER